MYVVQLGGRVHLYRSEARRDLLPGLVRHVVGAVAPDPVVHPHLLPGGPAEQLVDRHAQSLAFYVPQRLLDPGYGARQHRTTPIETAAIQDLKMVLDAERVAPGEVSKHLFHGGLYDLGLTLDDGLAPADDALVGRDFQEQPARRNLEQLERSYLHVLANLGTAAPRFSRPWSPVTSPINPPLRSKRALRGAGSCTGCGRSGGGDS